MRRAAPRPLANAVGTLTAALEPASTLARVQRVWEQAAGPTMAAAARPTSERDGVLTLTCVSAVWAQELSLMGAGVLESVNRALGEEDLIRELRCRSG